MLSSSEQFRSSVARLTSMGGVSAFALALTVSGCSLLLGADFDRPAASGEGGLPAVAADSGAEGDGGSERVPSPEPLHPDGTCAEGRKACGGQCVAIEDAQYGCGAASCTPACAAPVNGVATCAAGACRARCDAGFRTCGALCTPATTSCGAGWAAVASLPKGRSCAAAAGRDGRIYAMGGGGTASSPLLADVSAYNPSTNAWATVASMPTARGALAAAAGADGRIYAMGGFNSSVLTTVEVYAPSTDTWKEVASMPTARHYLAAATGTDGRVYALGGRNMLAGVLKVVEVYTPSTDTWAAVASMPTARAFLAATAGADGHRRSR